MRPLYGLADVGDAWWRTLMKFLMDALVLIQSVSDPYLLFIGNSSPEVLVGSYVQDLFFLGGKVMPGISKQILKCFPGKEMTPRPFFFASCYIE